MRQKLLLLSLMLLAVSAWGGASYAQTGPYKSLTFPDENRGNNGNSSYTESWTAQIGYDSWTIDCFNNNRWNSWTYIRCGSKKVASTASITTNFPIDQPIEDVVVTIDKITASSVNSITLEVANDNDFANIVETVTPTEISTGDMTFKINEPKENLYYKLVFDCNVGSSNGFIQISKVEYRTSEYISKKQTELSFGSEIDGQTLTVTEGEEASFVYPKATLIPAEAGSVTYSSDNEAVAKVDATTGAISFGELGTAKITASFAGNDAYGASSASYTIRYIAPIAENALVFDAENGAFENVKNSGGYNAYNNGIEQGKIDGNGKLILSYVQTTTSDFNRLLYADSNYVKNAGVGGATFIKDVNIKIVYYAFSSLWGYAKIAFGGESIVNINNTKSASTVSKTAKAGSTITSSIEGTYGAEVYICVITQ